jgi:putative addiction module killer protein
MLQVLCTAQFDNWISRLKDRYVKERVFVRIAQARVGNEEAWQAAGASVFELRGQGYRIYFTRVEDRLVLLLAGGDKATQKRHLLLASRLAYDLRKRHGS